MSNKSRYFFLGIVLLFGIGYFVYYLLTPDEIMAESAIQTMIEERYSGIVVSLEESDGGTGVTYEVEMHSAEGTYLIEVDAQEGGVLSFEQISTDTEFQEEQERVEQLSDEEISGIVQEQLSDEAEILDVQLDEDGSGLLYYSVAVNHSGNRGTLEIDANSKEVLSYTEDQVEQLTQQEAIEIALSEHAGVIDDIDLEQKNGRLVYEIEIENDATGVDADIIIDAYSGEVISVVLDN